MLFRPLQNAFLICIAIVMMAVGVRADEEPNFMKIMKYDQLMRLPEAGRREYIQGIRDLLVELQKMHPQKNSKVSAQIDFLRLFIEDAEAMGGGSGAAAWRGFDCPAGFNNEFPQIHEYRTAGGSVRCVPTGTRCPDGMPIFGNTSRGYRVCRDDNSSAMNKYRVAEQARQDQKKIAAANKRAQDAIKERDAARAQLRTPKRQMASTTPSHSSTAKRATKKSDDAAPDQTPDQKSDQQSEQQPDQPSPKADGQKQAPQLEEVQNLKELERITDGDDLDKAKAFDKDSRASYTLDTSKKARAKLENGQTLRTRDADYATENGSADDIVEMSRDDDGDVHISRRKIANFHMLDKADSNLTQLKEKDADTSNGEQACAIPSDSSLTCDAKKREEAAAQMNHSDDAHCFAAGNLSHFEYTTNKCQPVQDFCMNRVTCRDRNGHKPDSAQVLFRCNRKGEVLCNPYIFNLKQNDQPLCVPDDGKATQTCAARAQDDKPFFASTSSLNGVIEGWNEFAHKFNDMCFKSPSADYFCEDCKVIKMRLYKLARSVRKISNDKTDRQACYEMRYLERKKDSPSNHDIDSAPLSQ